MTDIADRIARLRDPDHHFARTRRYFAVDDVLALCDDYEALAAQHKETK